MPPSNLGGAVDPKRGSGNVLLDAVIDRTSNKPDNIKRKVRPVRVEFPTAASESRFKSCLAKVPVVCRMERKGSKRVIALRPKDLRGFDELIRTNGLADCETAINAVQWLQAHPDEFLRFESH